MQNTSSSQFKIIPIVLGLNEKFAPYAYTTMQSALDNILPGVHLAFHLFHEGISETVQNIGHSIFDTPCSSIKFINVQAWMERNQPSVVDNNSRSTFYRLAIPEIMRSFPRVIYLDSDIFMLRCPSLLYYAINDEAPLGAARDLLLIPAQHNGFHLPSDIAGGPSLIDYHRGALGVHNSDNYIQAGVLVFNIQNMTEEQILEHGRLASTLYWMMDQDVINRIFFDNICFIPPNWNVCWGQGCDEAAESLPESWKLFYREAHQNPFAIHFTGSVKPWNGWNGPYTDKYRETLTRVQQAF